MVAEDASQGSPMKLGAEEEKESNVTLRMEQENLIYM